MEDAKHKIVQKNKSKTARSASGSVGGRQAGKAGLLITSIHDDRSVPSAGGTISPVTQLTQKGVTKNSAGATSLQRSVPKKMPNSAQNNVLSNEMQDAPAGDHVWTDAEQALSYSQTGEDESLESSLPQIRPLQLASYLGQDHVKENLKVYIQAAKRLHKQLDHVIFHGPPGLGKTTLARIVAHELGVSLFETRGPAIDRPGDLAGILSSIKPGSVLFIDEIHRLSIKVEEVLYSAMEDFHLDVIIGQGPAARAIKMPIPPFTLIGATTRLSLLSKPLRDRFGIQERLEFYNDEALCAILKRSAEILNIQIDQPGCLEIARRSRGTPRIANRLLKRVWDFTVSYNHTAIGDEVADQVLTKQGIDRGGLDRVDRLMLKTVHEQYAGGPVGIEALAATINEDRATLEEVYEPFLVHMGYMARGPRGRMLTVKGRNHICSSK